MSEFDLAALIAEELHTNPSADPHVVAQTVAQRVPKKYASVVMAELLVHKVRESVRRERGHFTGVAPVSSKWKELGESTNAETWRVPVAEEWKFYLDLTAEDCDIVASQYEARAAANNAFAKQFRQLGDTLRQTGVKTVRELPDDVRPALQGAA